MNATASIISVVFSGVMMIIGIFTFMKSYGNGMIGQGRIEQKMDDIGSDVKEVRDDVKAQGKDLSRINERLATLEDKVKSAHHRIDGLEEKINKEGE